MNFRRGIFRIWILLGAIWALLVTLAMGPVLFSASRDVAFGLTDPRCCEAEYRVYATDELRNRFCPLSFSVGDGIDPSAAWWTLDEVRQYCPDFTELSDAFLVRELRSLQVDLAHGLAPYQFHGLLESLSAIGGFFFVLLSIPMLILLVGTALVWIVSGFRADPAKGA